MISGEIVEVSGGELVLPNASFLMAARTLIVGENNVLRGVEALQVGQYVEIRAVNQGAGNISEATKVRLFASIAETTALEPEPADVPTRFILKQNYPNPFNPTTVLSFHIEGQAASSVSLAVYNLLGQKVRTLIDDAPMSAGTYEYAWDARNEAGSKVSSGVYLYRLHVGDQVQTRTMVLLR